jgi:hypothetical protein
MSSLPKCYLERQTATPSRIRMRATNIPPFFPFRELYHAMAKSTAHAKGAIGSFDLDGPLAL